MKTKSLLILGIIFSLFACNNSSSKNDFIGIWESIEKHHTKTVMTFYQDSLILEALSGEFHTNSKWTIDDKQIYLKDIVETKNFFLDTLTYGYKFNRQKDTLTLKVLHFKPNQYNILVKVNENPF